MINTIKTLSLALMGLTVISTNLQAANPASQQWVLEKIASFQFATQAWVTSTLNSKKTAFVQRGFAAYPVSQPVVGPIAFSETVSQPTPILFNIQQSNSTTQTPSYDRTTGTFTINKTGVYSTNYTCGLVLQNNSATSYDVIQITFYLTDASLVTRDTIPRSQIGFSGTTVMANGSSWNASMAGTSVNNYTQGQTINLSGQTSYAQVAGVSQPTTPGVSIQVGDCSIAITQIS